MGEGVVLKNSFFLKYYDYKIGIRYTIEGPGPYHTLLVEYNQEPSEEDIMFARGIKQLTSLRERLKDLYGSEEGEDLFIHFVQDLFLQAERTEKNKRRRKKK